ncbi:MAG: S1C family serine protease [Sciscionella sp.]
MSDTPPGGFDPADPASASGRQRAPLGQPQGDPTESGRHGRAEESYPAHGGGAPPYQGGSPYPAQAPQTAGSPYQRQDVQAEHGDFASSATYGRSETEGVLYGTAFRRAGSPDTAALPAYGSHTAPGTPVPAGSGSPRRSGLVIGVVLLALIAGAIAGGLTAEALHFRDAATQATTSSPNALEEPAPTGHPVPVTPGSVADVAQKLLPTVIQLRYRVGQGEVSGSGVVFSADGLVLTNNHVVAQDHNTPIEAVFQNGKTGTVRVVGTDPTSDLAVVKVEGVSGLPTAQFGNSADVRVGAQVVAIGSPFELSGTVTAGIVSALHRPTAAGGDGNDQNTVLDAIQTDAAINPGNSGGPLVDMSGRVIGINSAIYSPSSASGLGNSQQSGNVGIGFAIPIDQAKRIGDELAKTGTAMQTVLGVAVTDDPSGSGAQIRTVTPGGPAARAGLRTGDVVTTAAGRPVASANGLVAAVHAAAPGQTLNLGLRDGRTVTPTLTGQPVNRK